MARSNYPNGFSEGALIRELPSDLPAPRKNIWVGNNATLLPGEKGASDSTNNGTFLRPFSTLDYAIGQAKAGDFIWLRPGYNQAVNSAGALALDVAGITVVFLGNGANRASITFGTVVGADVDITAANITLVNPRLVTDKDNLTAGIHVAAADFRMINVEDYDSAGKAATVMVLTTSAAQRLRIEGYKYFASTTGTQKTDRIKTVGALDGVVLRDIDISGDFTGGYPVNLANAACTNLVMESLNINNTNAGPVAALGLHANTTGFAKSVKLRVASGTTYVSSAAKVQWATDCEGFATDGNGGVQLGTASDLLVPTADSTANVLMRDAVGNKTDAAVTAKAANKSGIAYLKGILDLLGVFVNSGGTADLKSIIGDFSNVSLATKLGAFTNTGGTASIANILGDVYNVSMATRLGGASRVASVNLANTDLTGTVTRFTVAGSPIVVEHLFLYITSALPAGANTLKLSFTPTGGGATDLSGTTDTASGGQGQIYVMDGVKVTGPVKTGDVGIMLRAAETAMPVILGTGVIQTIFSAGPPASGAAILYLIYKPLAINGTVS